jgi:DNA polymerase III epsilon subunit-like protein
MNMDYLEYFKEYTLRKEKDPKAFEEKVYAGYTCESKNVRLIYFDLETSSPCERNYPIASVDSIIEIGAVSEQGTFSKLCNPGHPIFTTAVNGITDDDVKGAPHTRTVLKAFFEWAQPGEYDATLLIAHNAASFDLKVLRSHIARYFPDMKCDNMYVADSLHPLRKQSDASSAKLEEIYRHVFEQDYVEKHRALEDAKDLKRITEHVCKEKNISCAHMMSGNAYPLMSETMKPKVDINQYFDVPFPEKDVAKKFGAKWCPVKKLWFAPTDEIKATLLTKFQTKF